MICVAGLDLGKENDFSALAVIEAFGTQRTITWDGPHAMLPACLATHQETIEVLPFTELRVRHVERYPLRTTYLKVRDATAAWLRTLPQPRFLGVDHTGPGIPVAEIFGSLLPAAWLTITTGSGSRRIGDTNCFHVAKKDLIAGGQVALQRRILKIAPSLPHAEVIESEMRAYVAKPTSRGNVTYEAERESAHDDLVCALCLAIWLADQAFRVAAERAVSFLEERAAQALFRATQISPI